MNKIIVFDLETTGFANACGVHQISMLLVVNGELIAEIVHDVYPGEVMVQAEALMIANKTMDDIRAHTPIADVIPEINQELAKHIAGTEEKWILCGYNNKRFDNRFIKAIYEKYSPLFPFHVFYHDDTMDVSYMAKDFYKGKDSKPESFKLADVARHMGIEVDSAQLHRANYDAILTYKLFMAFKMIEATESLQNSQENGD